MSIQDSRAQQTYALRPEKLAVPLTEPRLKAEESCT